MGASKVNFDSELKQAFINSIMEFMKDNKEEYDIRKIFRPGIDSQKEICVKKIKACKSDNKN
jgi:fructose/tagatose bisphosphate aldolase